MARSPKRIHAKGKAVGSKELNRLKDHLGKDHGTFPVQTGWPTEADLNVEKNPPNSGEPLVQSVRTYLANEPHKIVVRVLSEPELEPQSTDLHIVPDNACANSSNEGTSLKRNDLNNNSKNKVTSAKNTEENPSSETNKPVESCTMPSAADRLQRQPLLAPNKQPSHVITIEESGVNDGDGTQMGSQLTNGDLQLSELPNREERYPKEILKTLLSVFFLFVCVTINLASLSMTHERVPNRARYAPLPDIFLSNVPASDWGLTVSEYIIMVTTTTVGVILFMHKYRCIVIRRVVFVVGLLYLYRSVTMFVTVLPMSSTTYYCSPKLNHTTPGIIIERIVHLMSGFGLAINGKHTYCGDFIYSGHTTILVVGYLIIAEYSPRKLHMMHWIYFFGSIVGVFFIMLAHSHYSVDVIIAYYISTRLFWTYNSLLRIPHQSTNNLMITREWWYRLFLYFEENVYGPVPRQYDWPLPWPKFLIKFFSRLS